MTCQVGFCFILKKHDLSKNKKLHVAEFMYEQIITRYPSRDVIVDDAWFVYSEPKSLFFHSVNGCN